MDSGGRRGGSLKVLELLQDHPIELAYDFRHKFNLSFQDIGTKITLLEAVMLIGGLMQQTDSMLQAKVSGWKFPVSREWSLLADIYDLLANANFKKPKPYPVPWSSSQGTTIGSSKQSRSDVLKRLEAMNPKESNGN